MLENNEIENEEVFRFRYNEDITKLPAIEEKYFFSRTVDVFRTFITVPPTDKDITPNVYRYENENLQPYNPSKEELELLDETDQLKYITARAISVHDTREQEEKAAKHSYESLERKLGPEEAEKYIREKRGTYVGQLHITPEHGKISQFHKHHANVLLFEGIKIEDILVEGSLKPYMYKEEKGGSNE